MLVILFLTKMKYEDKYKVKPLAKTTEEYISTDFGHQYKMQNGDILVPADPGPSRKMAVKMEIDIQR